MASALVGYHCPVSYCEGGSATPLAVGVRALRQRVAVRFHISRCLVERLVVRRFRRHPRGDYSRHPGYGCADHIYAGARANCPAEFGNCARLAELETEKCLFSFCCPVPPNELKESSNKQQPRALKDGWRSSALKTGMGPRFAEARPIRGVSPRVRGLLLLC